MKRFLLLAILILTAPAFASDLKPTQKSAIWVTINDEVIVKAIQENDYAILDIELQEVLKNASINSISDPLPDTRDVELMNVFELSSSLDENDLLQLIARYSKFFIRPEIAPSYELLYDPNDLSIMTSFDYSLDLINAQHAWNITKGSEEVVIGISDQNYYLNHEDLVGKFDYVDETNTAPRTHGTAVATMAAGNTDNALGKASIGFNCRLRLYRMSYNEIIRASQDGVDVLNISWAAHCYNSYYGQLIIDEAYHNGTILVAAAGNGGTCGGPNHFVYPASYNHVIAVSSVGPADNHERFIGNPNATFHHNEKVDIVAPGYDVLLSLAPGYYVTGNGTSFSAPIVTGVVGLILSVDPCLNFEQVEEILYSSAKDIYDLNPQYMGKLGAGRVDAFKAVREARKYQSCHRLKSTVVDAPEITTSIYPNPTKDKFTVSSSEEVAYFDVIDLNGKVVLRSTELTVQHQLKSGVYLIHLYGSSKELLLTSRLIVE